MNGNRLCVLLLLCVYDEHLVELTLRLVITMFILLGTQINKFISCLMVDCNYYRKVSYLEESTSSSSGLPNHKT